MSLLGNSPPLTQEQMRQLQEMHSSPYRFANEPRGKGNLAMPGDPSAPTPLALDDLARQILEILLISNSTVISIFEGERPEKASEGPAYPEGLAQAMRASHEQAQMLRERLFTLKQMIGRL